MNKENVDQHKQVNYKLCIRIIKNILKILLPIVAIVIYIIIFDKMEMKKHFLQMFEINTLAGGIIGIIITWVYKN